MPKFFNQKFSRAELEQRLASSGSANPGGPDKRIITDWLTHLHVLKGIPFNYLLPDVRMLPTESIRFFQVDNNWIEALLDGAFNPGSSTAAAAGNQMRENEEAIKEEAKINAAQMRRKILGQQEAMSGMETISGFFLRSAVVSGWPHIEVNGYADTEGEKPVHILRFERINPTLMIALFNGLIQRVDIHEPSEGLHFGVLPYSPGATIEKDLRYAATGSDGEDVGDIIENDGNSVTVTVPFRSNSRGVIQMNAMAMTMQNMVWPDGVSPGNFTSAEFALELVQGVELVSFKHT